jgi:hypothetical protein
MKKTALAAALLACGISAHAVAAPAASPFAISIERLGTYATGIFDQSAAEIVAHDPKTQRLFVVNAQADAIDVLNILTPDVPERLNSIVLDGVVNSVAVHKGLVAVAVEAEEKTDNGEVVFLTTDGKTLARVTVGALPDML